jgi:outer membrane receptor for ferric coprogen and ferric-rhodotorulic acid
MILMERETVLHPSLYLYSKVFSSDLFVLLCSEDDSCETLACIHQTTWHRVTDDKVRSHHDHNHKSSNTFTVTCSAKLHAPYVNVPQSVSLKRIQSISLSVKREGLLTTAVISKKVKLSLCLTN